MTGYIGEDAGRAIGAFLSPSCLGWRLLQRCVGAARVAHGLDLISLPGRERCELVGQAKHWRCYFSNRAGQGWRALNLENLNHFTKSYLACLCIYECEWEQWSTPCIHTIYKSFYSLMIHGTLIVAWQRKLLMKHLSKQWKWAFLSKFQNLFFFFFPS